MSGSKPDAQFEALSGAQLTLQDLTGTPGYTLRSENSPEPPPINPDGWLGLPDPNKYPPNTTNLTSYQLRQEKKKGNIISLADLQKLPWKEKEVWLNKQESRIRKVQQRIPALSQASSSSGSRSKKVTFDLTYKFSMLSFLLSKPNPARPDDVAPLWKDPKKVMGVVTDWMKHHSWVRLWDGSTISLWNLFQYVDNNPEMKAMVKRHVRGFDNTNEGDGSSWERMQNLMPWQVRAGAPKMVLPADMEEELPHGLVAESNIYSRKPTRWLKGMDAIRDFGYGLYVHEDHAEMVMRRKWGGLSPEKVLQDGQYYMDLINYGPDMSMTLMAVTARDLPLEQYKELWGNRVKTCLSLYQPTDEHMQRLQELKNIFDGEAMAASTKLMTPDGTKLREGAKLLFNTNSKGQILVQAVSPGTLREQESYILGAVEDRDLCSALLASVMHPAVEDQEFVMKVGRKMLFYINGFKSRNRDNNPNQQLVGAPHHFEAEIIPAEPESFILPPVGLPPMRTMVSTLSDRVAFVSINQAFDQAREAALKVKPGKNDDETAAREKAAMEAALARVLVPLGVPQDLIDASPADISGAATELQVEGAAQA